MNFITLGTPHLGSLMVSSVLRRVRERVECGGCTCILAHEGFFEYTFCLDEQESFWRDDITFRSTVRRASQKSCLEFDDVGVQSVAKNENLHSFAS